MFILEKNKNMGVRVQKEGGGLKKQCYPHTCFFVE
jgi:hypothetical protein